MEAERLSIIKKYFNDVKLTEITVSAIEEYQAKRKKDGISNRTINMDVGALRRVLKRAGRWRTLGAGISNLPENGVPIGRALKKKEKERLLEVAASNPEWEHVYCAAIIAANTSMRPVEVKNLRWQDVDLFAETLTVRRSKNLTSQRVIPFNQSAKDTFLKMYRRAKKLGFTAPSHYIWPASQWGKIDPTQPTEKWDTVWRNLQIKADLPGLRFHDLRHTIITELAEIGAPDHVMESISGHLSRRMLEHYSHIRLDAKRRALDLLDATGTEAV